MRILIVARHGISNASFRAGRPCDGIGRGARYRSLPLSRGSLGRRRAARTLRGSDSAARSLVEGAGRREASLPLETVRPQFASRAAELLSLPYHSVAAVKICRNKFAARERFREAGLPSTALLSRAGHSEPLNIAHTAKYPCVLKPLGLSGSGTYPGKQPT